jgi:hypothetical protein
MLAAVVVVAAAAGCAAESPEGGPVGSEFDVARQQVSASPCPRFAEELLPHYISVTSATELLVDGHAAQSFTVVTAAANQDAGDEPNIAFTVRESWTSTEGAVAPPIAYRLWAHDDEIVGMATTSFAFDTPTLGTDCSYGWLVSGSRL